jgi:hypothetical protein
MIAAGCARFGYDLIEDPDPGLGSLDGLVTSAAGAAGALALSDAGSAEGGAAPDAFDAASPVAGGQPPFQSGAAGGDSGHGGSGGLDAGGLQGSGADSGGSAGSVGNPVDRACVLRGTETLVQQFDTATPFIQARGGNSSVIWTAAEGNPSPGALDFDMPAGGTAELYSANLTGNLTGRHMFLNVYVAAGSSVRMRLFVETGNQARRGYGPYVSPPLGTWGCSDLDLQAPVATDPGFDAGNVSGAGLEVEGSGEVEIYADQIAY